MLSHDWAQRFTMYTITQQYISVRQDCQTLAFVATANDGL